MPLSLTTMSRRRFLQSSLALGVTAAMPGALSAAFESLEDDRISLLSDVHVSGTKRKMSQRLTVAVRQILSQAARPDRVLVAGDCAHLRGRLTDYREYIRTIQPLVAAGLPLHMALGNHDHRDNFWDALPAEHASAETQIERQSCIVPGRRANWFMLDSLHRTNRSPGELGSDQLGWLEAALDQHAHKPALIMLHHPPDRAHADGSLNDSDALLDIVRPRRHVKAMFFGHKHIWEVSRDRSGIHMVGLPATGYTLWWRSFIGWIDCRIRQDGATLQVHSLKTNEKAHGQIVPLTWRAG